MRDALTTRQRHDGLAPLVSGSTTHMLVRAILAVAGGASQPSEMLSPPLRPRTSEDFRLPASDMNPASDLGSSENPIIRRVPPPYPARARYAATRSATCCPLATQSPTDTPLR